MEFTLDPPLTSFLYKYMPLWYNLVYFFLVPVKECNLTGFLLILRNSWVQIRLFSSPFNLFCPRNFTLPFFSLTHSPLKHLPSFAPQSIQSARLSFQVVRIGSPLWVQGGRHTRLWGRGWGNPIPTKGQTLWYSVYTIIPLRSALIVNCRAWSYFTPTRCV